MSDLCSKLKKMKKIRVAVIDDIRDILELIEYNLNKEGMDVDIYTDSSVALSEIVKNKPDLVISDWMMPGHDGLEVFRQLKSNKRTKNIPLLMLTCKSSLHDYREARQAGARDYIVKPVRMDELIRRIKLLLPLDRIKRRLV